MTTPDYKIEPGVYPDMPMDEYHASKAVSSTFLRKCQRSIAHGLSYLESDHEQSKVQRLGTGIHCAVLEPERFESEYLVEPPVDVDDMNWRHVKTAKFLSKGKSITEAAEKVGVRKGTVERYAERDDVQELRVWYMHHDPDDLPDVSGEELERIIGARDAVMAHPMASALVGAANAEVSYFWDDETGLRCRCRPDAERLDLGRIIDVKTTDDARPGQFAKHIAWHGYHIQGAMYSTGVSELIGCSPPLVTFVVVETTPPYGCMVYDLIPEEIEAGMASFREQMDELAAYYRGEISPGYPTEIQTISRPEWATKDESYE